MNKEIIKAMNRKEKKTNTIRKWWNKNGYKVMRILLFYIWIPMLCWGKIQRKLNDQQEWSEERADEILSYYIPRRSQWVNEDKEFYFFDNGMGWSIYSAKKKLKFKDRRWWKKYACGWGGQIRKYLIEKFELDGFEKEVLNTSDGYTELVFHLRA